MLSDGAIYSSIDFTTKANYNSPGQTSQATPYATTQILHSSSIHELAVDLPDPQWKASLQAKQEMASLGYSLPEKTSCNNSKMTPTWAMCCENAGDLMSIPRLCFLFFPVTSKGINPDYTLHIYMWELGTCSVSQGLMEAGKGSFLKASGLFPSQKEASIHFLVGIFMMVSLRLPFQSNYQSIFISNNI